ncbi:MAG: histidine phosphatase family protein [Dehalococcoidia bacterium]
MAVHLVRHGEAFASFDHLDPGLSERGHRQAAHVAEWAKGTNARRLVVSPLQRTRETAAPIAATLGIEAEYRDQVAEVFDPTTPVAERVAMLPDFIASRWSEQPAGLRAWRRRVVETVTALAQDAETAGHDVIIVSHFVAIGAVIGEATGEDAIIPVPMANAAITTLEAHAGGLRLLHAASTAHLPPELVTGMSSAIAGLVPPP